MKTSFVRLVAVSAALLVAALPRGAFADDGVPTDLTSIPGNAPFSIQSCTFHTNLYYYLSPFLTIESTNLNPSRKLERIQVHVQLYDDIHSKTAQTTIESTGMDLDPGETNRGRMFFEGDHFISKEGVHSAVCTIKSVTFDGGSAWRAGIPWTGKIIKQDASNGNGQATSESSSISSSRHASPAAVTVALGKAWVTNVPNNEPNSGTFVHVRVTLASPGGVDVWPAEFPMNMTLGNGATKAYSPLQQPAPMVLRGGFLSYSGDPSQLGPSIAPGEDFGAIGKMSLQPNVGVTTVLTYRVDDLGGSGSVRSVDFVR